MEPDRDDSHANESHGAESPSMPLIDAEGVGPEEEGAVGWLALPSPFSPEYPEAVFNLFHPAPSDAPMELNSGSDNILSHPPGLRPDPLGPIPRSFRDIIEEPSMSHASPADIYFDDTGIIWKEGQAQMSDSDGLGKEAIQRVIEELCAEYPPLPPPDAPLQEPSTSHASPADIYFDDTGIVWKEGQAQMSDSDGLGKEAIQRVIEELCAEYPPLPPPDAPVDPPMEVEADAEALAHAAHADIFQDTDMFEDDDLEQ